MSHIAGRALQTYAVVTAAMALVLILAGGLVTTTATGDTIPTWPLSWGRLIPPTFAGGVVVEWSHRVMAGTVALLVIGLTLWSRGTSRKVASIALAGVLVQAAIGGLRIFVPQAAVSIVHACFGQVVFCAVAATALVLSRAWASTSTDANAAAARKLAVVTASFAFLQLVAGAVTRHTGAGLVVHLVGAAVVLLHATLLSSRLLTTSLSRGAWVLAALAGTQLILGLASWSIRTQGFVRSHEAAFAPIVFVTLHVAVGAAMLATTVVLSMLCFKARVAEGGLVPQAA